VGVSDWRSERTFAAISVHHQNHTDAFWNEVDKVLPDYKKRYEWLKHNGAGLDISQ
jgi:hypothetical protein